jgi:hypothetical protein
MLEIALGASGSQLARMFVLAQFFGQSETRAGPS